MTQEIIITPPGPDAPGYLRRLKEYWKWQRGMEAGDPEAVEGMIRFVVESAETVIAPEGVDPVEAIMEMSRDEYMALIAATAGLNADDGVDPQNGG